MYEQNANQRSSATALTNKRSNKCLKVSMQRDTQKRFQDFKF